MKKYALVLGGGGAKGAYHLGVWEALCKMNIEIGMICGTSIGAINGAMICQGDFSNLQKIWNEITIEKVVDITNSDITGESLFEFKNIKEFIGRIYNKDGFEMTPLKSLLEEYIDEEKIRESQKDFAMVTCKLNGFEEIALKKDEIPKGKLVDYLMASASIPGFKPVVIENEQYVDGGVKNNIPWDVAKKSGYSDIIIVDVGGMGIVKNYDFEGCNVFNIKVSKSIMGMMEFNHEAIEKAIKTGYYDCFKAFSRLKGEKYNFNIGDYHQARLKYSKKILSGLEEAAEIFGIDNLKVYKVEDLIDGVIKGYKENKVQKEEKVKRNDEKTALTELVDFIISEKEEGFINKMTSGFRGGYNAANALVYLLKNRQK